ncbi:MAG: SMP-30/gluconolactonase/LRE family protein, partial [Opitutales bacterium]
MLKISFIRKIDAAMRNFLSLLGATVLLSGCGNDQAAALTESNATDTPAPVDKNGAIAAANTNSDPTDEEKQPLASEPQSNGLVVDGAKPVKLAGGFKFTEGPAVAPNGNIFFTDIPNNRIHRWNPKEKKVSIFMENSGGANGLFFSKEGDLFACQGVSQRVTSFYLVDGGEKELLADQYDGRSFNRPNDLWVHPNNGVFFSDPNYGKKDLSQDGEHLYFITPYRDQVLRVDKDLKRPNGIIGTPDGKTLYVADPGQGKTFRYTM